MTCRKVLYLSPSQKGGGVVLYMNLLFRFFKMFSSHFYPSTLLVLYIIGAYTSLSLIHIYFIVPLVSLSISPPPLPCHMCCLSRLTAFQSLLGAWQMSNEVTSILLCAEIAPLDCWQGGLVYLCTVKHLIFARTKFRECGIQAIREHLIFANRGGSELSKTFCGLKIGPLLRILRLIL